MLGSLIHDGRWTLAAKAADEKTFIAALRRCATQVRVAALAGGLVLLALPLAGQIRYGEFQAQANGMLTTGYSGAFGDQQVGNHSIDVGGNGTINGFYYNPNFLSFSVIPYYNRSQNNSDSQSITDSSGYSGTLNIFNGSHFPGVVNFNQEFDGSGTLGIPGEAGLITKTRGHGFGISWSELLPDWPTLTVGYSDTSGTSSLYGSDFTTANTTRNFMVNSSYHIAGFALNGGYNHVNTDARLTGVLENGAVETTNGASNLFRVNAVRGLPFYNSQLSM
ncbi:MAG: hypothetical protein ACRD3Q_02465, partial [Terriglobales bacterium]